jgi:hypothetical protein
MPFDPLFHITVERPDAADIDKLIERYIARVRDPGGYGREDKRFLIDRIRWDIFSTPALHPSRSSSRSQPRTDLSFALSKIFIPLHTFTLRVAAIP